MAADPSRDATATERWADVFIGESAMARTMRRHDWAATPLGDPTGWPLPLKVALRILLTNRFEMWLGWGPELYFFYNDGYRPTLGEKHPWALGRPAAQVWAEIWPQLDEQVRRVFAGEGTWNRDMLLLMQRRGYPEETYHTFSYSPLFDEAGAVAGLFCTVSEDTTRVIAERRFAAVRFLASGLAAAKDRASVAVAAARSFGTATRDLPFSMAYVFDDAGGAELLFTAGIARGHVLAPARLDAAALAPWPAAALREGGVYQITLPQQGLALPSGAWTTQPTHALAVPIGPQGGEQALGFVVAALNPHRALDLEYRGFVQLMTTQLASGLAGADAYQAERRRSAALTEAVQRREAAAEGLAAEVLARTAERDSLRELFLQAPGFVCVMRGPQLVHELVNESYRRLVGGRRLIGVPLREALPELEGQGLFEVAEHVLASGRPFVGQSVRMALVPRPGAAPEEHFVNFVYQPIRAGDGRVEGIFVEGYDVTEQVRSQKALEVLNDSLEQRIGERTAALAAALASLQEESAERERAEDELRQAQKMEAVGQLTGGLAHDFNNLLQGITGSLELLRRRIAMGQPEQAERHIAAAMTAATRAAALTHRLLAFSRRQPLDPKPVEPNPLVEDMLELLQRTLGERVRIRLQLAERLWVTRCDANQLESALLNLCLNARDAMPDGGALTIATSNVRVGADDPGRRTGLHPGEYVRIAVTDTGTGMSPDVAARAFEPFFTTKPLGQGTGLGLSMIYGFARQSEGWVRIETQPGAGTTVALYLPRHLGEGDIPQEAEVQPPAAAEERASGTVLVVEDEGTVRGLVVEILAELGYDAIEAENGPAGLEVLMGPRSIDLLVTDIGLPGLNGRQVADAGRERRPGLKVLFMTGYAENAAAAAGFLEPGMEMITKPFGLDTLLATLRRLLPQP